MTSSLYRLPDTTKNAVAAVTVMNQVEVDPYRDSAGDRSDHKTGGDARQIQHGLVFGPCDADHATRYPATNHMRSVDANNPATASPPTAKTAAAISAVRTGSSPEAIGHWTCWGVCGRNPDPVRR